MKLTLKFVLLFFTLCICASIKAQLIHHEINTSIDINAKSIYVTDSIKIPEAFLKNDKDSLIFSINAGFKIVSVNTYFKLIEIKALNKDSSEIKTKKYFVQNTGKNKKINILPLQYSGIISGKIKSGPVEYARGFSETSGIISSDGIYLANSTKWIPDFDTPLFTFNLTTVIDSSWGVISQGTRTKVKINNDKKIIRYESPDPADEVYLIAAKWKEYNRKTGNILVQAELRKPDTSLAAKYLGATIDYLALYNKLIGPYPYSKFTLVENFWETGYGMPSFTLLGEQVIRLPFILNSSYPHELLHNYWGNSVYVNNEKGNWCEGLTVYMADHLIKEQQGQGVEYRRSTLLKFTDFVNGKNDFPITEFRSRNNSAEEAIGYGKVMMIFEMLRYNLGDEVFLKSIAKFYKDNKFKMATFDDIRKSFEEVSGQDLNLFFDQWITRKGAPALKLSDVKVIPKNNMYELNFSLSQIQKENPFSLKVPVVIYFQDDKNVVVKDVIFNKRTETFTMIFAKRPVKIEIDPEFNVFRRLDKNEEPLSISQIYGDSDVVIVLPKNSPFIKEYTDLAEQWKQTQMVQGNKIDIKFDADLKDLPDKATWIIGFENKFAVNLNVFDNYSAYLPNETNEKIESLKKTGALVYVFPNFKNKSLTNGFLGSNNQKLILSLKKKVLHYTSYSYLGFEGDEATNKLKGEFPVLNSPLSYNLIYNGKDFKSLGKLILRKALAY